jgi:predicted transcriptional regulator
MSVNLPSDIAASLQEFLDFEGYTNEVDVIRDALPALKRELDLAGIREGIADMEAGRYRTWEEVDAEIRQKFGFGPPKAPPKD